jgi:hypothetical protein
MVDATKNDKAPLEDIMAAMDVVDTLRHDQSIAERELDGESRRKRLLERLRNMYAAQGIDVPDHVLEEGIDALEQERFQYIPVTPSWRTKLARVWVNRGRWGKPLGIVGAIALVLYALYFVFEVMPLRALKANLPTEISLNLQQISELAKNPDITEQAKLHAADARRAIANDDYDEAQDIVEDMQVLKHQLGLVYDIRVISRENENSGVFRNPPGNNVRNFYLIVEAIDQKNQVVELMIVNQENNKVERKKTWGLRVEESTFYRISSDKLDDGIIQNNQVGRKLAGYLKPEYSIPTTGATITEW